MYTATLAVIIMLEGRGYRNISDNTYYRERRIHITTGVEHILNNNKKLWRYRQ